VKIFNRQRVRQIVMVGGIETLGVILGGVAGLLIVNVLPKEQYAAYTFLVACMTLMLGVTDMGLAHCCLPVVGQRSKEVDWVVGACHQVFSKRWVLLVLGLVIIVPYWIYTSRQHDWTGGGYWLASLVMLGVVLVTLREHYANTVLLILGHISTLNRVAFVSHMARIACVAAVLVLPITAYSIAGLTVATAAASATALYFYAKAFKAHRVGVSRLDTPDAKRVDAQIVKIATPLVLPAIFYQVQGVVTVFIVSLFGTANMIAEVGAFGRLSMVLLVVDRVTNVLLFPAIARAPASSRLTVVLAQVHLLYMMAVGAVFLTAVIFPNYWILLLGEQYRNMVPYVWMVFLSSILMNAAGFAFRTLAVRGATARQGFIIVAVVATQVLYLWLVGANTLRAVLGFGLATAFANFAYQYGLLTLRWFEWRRS
jgi:O-antigen/teichoic acid export membrane protein